jgi:hypothetical protein
LEPVATITVSKKNHARRIKSRNREADTANYDPRVHAQRLKPVATSQAEQRPRAPATSARPSGHCPPAADGGHRTQETCDEKKQHRTSGRGRGDNEDRPLGSRADVKGQRRRSAQFGFFSISKKAGA